MPKKTLRQQMLLQRNSLHPHDRTAACSAIQQRLMSLPLFTAASSIVLYAPIRNEVETGGLFEAAQKRGMTVLFPAVSGDGLLFGVVTKKEDLTTGKYGIPEPPSTSLQRLPQEVDLVVVPAVAFSLKGQRIGYGRGFYDRTLHCLEGSGRLVGICYDFQLVDEMPHEPHDVRVDLVITEKRVIDPRHLS